jgi:DNA polymerase type B, organellar and viral
MSLKSGEISTGGRQREFIGWDGEGWTDHTGSPCDCLNPFGQSAPDYAGGCPHHYCLFGASSGESVDGVSLSTGQCLDLISQVGRDHPDAIHIAYAFEYDVNMILRDLSPQHMKHLRENHFVKYRNYRIEHYPKKWFQVTEYIGDDEKTVTRIQDVFTYFASSFVAALRAWNVGAESDLQQIEKGKAERSSFSLARLDEFVRPYWRKELDLLVTLGETLRTRFSEAGLHPKDWYGPGCVASTVYADRGLKGHMDRELPDGIRQAAAYAYAGGRFQLFKAGLHNDKIYNADINSAYPYAMSTLPSLRNGKWEYTRSKNRIIESADVCRLGLVEVSIQIDIRKYRGSVGLPFPLFRRYLAGNVTFPQRVWGTYQLPEFRVLLRLREEFPHVFKRFHIRGAWLFHDDGSYPFKWVADMYGKRQEWKRNGIPAQLALKLCLNSLYGKLAQRVGGIDGPPTWHQLEWAGLITSTCRAMLLETALSCGENLVSMDTDGIYSTSPIDLPASSVGTGLGQWEVSSFEGGLFLQSGIYWLKKDGKWEKPKTRGIPRSSMDVDAAMESLISQTPMTAMQTSFVGYGLGLMRNPPMRGWRTWETTQKTFSFGGDGKMSHVWSKCRPCYEDKGWHECLHELAPPVDQDFFAYQQAKSEREEVDMWDFYKSSIHTLKWEGEEFGFIKQGLSDTDEWEGIYE